MKSSFIFINIKYLLYQVHSFPIIQVEWGLAACYSVTHQQTFSVTCNLLPDKNVPKHKRMPKFGGSLSYREKWYWNLIHFPIKYDECLITGEHKTFLIKSLSFTKKKKEFSFNTITCNMMVFKYLLVSLHLQISLTIVKSKICSFLLDHYEVTSLYKGLRMQKDYVCFSILLFFYVNNRIVYLVYIREVLPK